jgi:hypothetical protein
MEHYCKVTPLPFVSDDVKRLGLTLRERGGYEVVEIVDAPVAPPGGESPKAVAEAVQRILHDWLASLEPEQDALVYLGGHGFRDKQGRLYFATIDCDPADPTRGAVPVAWLRDRLAACPARFKLLVIDACHAGSEKAGPQIKETPAKDSPQLILATAKELALPLEGTAGVITLASSQGDEKSLIWGEKQQSLFTYWFNEGLRGHADNDADGAVTIDELYSYVHQHVTTVAQKRFQRQQTPARIIGCQVPGVPVVIRPTPQTLKGLLEDVAEKLATEMQLQGLSRVGVPEFIADSRTGPQLGGSFGVLGRSCAVELGGRLALRSAEKFEVIEQDALEAALGEKQVSARSLVRSAKDLTVGDKKVPALVLGTLRSRAGRAVTIDCRLIDSANETRLATAGGTALLNESEWAMVGHSIEVPLPAAPGPDNPVPPHLADPIPMCDQLARQPHPFRNPGFPFSIKIMVKGKERTGEFFDNDYVVPLQKGEVYTLRVETKDDRVVFMRLLVDSLNTLPEPVRTKGAKIEAVEQVQFQAAQSVNLTEAQAWQLDPKFSRVYEVRGFYSDVGAAGKYREFVVSCAPESLSERSRYGEQLGILTAAFYAEKGDANRGGVKTVPGEERAQETRLYRPTGVGNLLHVVHIRYMDPQSLAKLKAGQ